MSKYAYDISLQFFQVPAWPRAACLVADLRRDGPIGTQPNVIVYISMVSACEAWNKTE